MLIFGQFWVIFRSFWQFWVIFGPFWVIFGLFSVIFGPFFGANFFLPKIYLCYFYHFLHLWDPLTTNQGHTKQVLKRTMKVGKMGLNEEEEEDVQDNLGQI